jgi:hypothetical protein
MLSTIRSICLQRKTNLESVLLGGQDQRRDLLRELIVVIEFVLIEERLPVPLQVGADLLVLGMFDNQLGNFLVAEINGGQQRLVHTTSIDIVEQELDRLLTTTTTTTTTRDSYGTDFKFVK